MHRGPPSLADLGFGDGLPALFVFDLDIGEELIGGGMRKDGVVVSAMAFQDLFQFGPDGPMAMLIFVLATGMNCHNECFSQHIWQRPVMARRLTELL